MPLLPVLTTCSVVGLLLHAQSHHRSWGQKVKLSTNSPLPLRVFPSFGGATMSIRAFSMVAFHHEGDGGGHRGISASS